MYCKRCVIFFLSQTALLLCGIRWSVSRFNIGIALFYIFIFIEQKYIAHLKINWFISCKLAKLRSYSTPLGLYYNGITFPRFYRGLLTFKPFRLYAIRIRYYYRNLEYSLLFDDLKKMWLKPGRNLKQL